MARLPTPGTRVRWLLTVVAVAAVLALGLTYLERLDGEQESLLASIAQSNKTIEALREVDLSKIQAEVDELKSRATTAASREASLSRKYRTYTHSIEIQERIYQAAEEAGVTVTALTCDGPRSLESGGLTLQNYVLSVDAQAEVPPSLLNFLLKVSGYFESATIGTVNMSIPKPPEEESTETISAVSFTLQVTYLPEETD